MSDELPDECCAKCRFWWYGDDPGIPGMDPGTWELPTTRLYCRRFPPISFPLAMVPQNCDFAMTKASWWCGEFQPVKKPGSAG
jgi:hypothetical protein